MNMSLRKTEQNALIELRQLFVQTADQITERDAAFLHTATTAVLCAMMDAGTKGYTPDMLNEQIQRILNHVREFIKYRKDEGWVTSSTYLYGFSKTVMRNL